MSAVLVTGATGNVGPHLVRELRDRGVRVRALVRDTVRARAMLGDDVDLAVGDLAEPASVAASLAGVDRVFLLTPSHPRMVAYERAVLDAARAADVRRVVKMSTVGADPRSEGRFARWQGECEDLLRSSGIPWVILRPSYHMTNVLPAAATVRSAGTIFAPLGDAKIAMVDRRDLAAVAAVTLTEDGHEGRTYVLTGPEAVTYHSVAEQLAQALGRDVRYVDVPEEAAVDAMVQAGAEDWLVNGVTEVYRQVRRGIAEETTDWVRRLTGRPPYAFLEFARDTAAAFR